MSTALQPYRMAISFPVSKDQHQPLKKKAATSEDKELAA